MAIDAPERTEGGNPSIEVVHDRNSPQDGGADSLEKIQVTPPEKSEAQIAEETRARKALSRELAGELAVQQAPLDAPDWRTPFYVRWRLLSVAALLLSAAWVSLAALYSLSQIGL
ncbi:MAG: hypothetical protein QF393_15265, partial [Rhodospirillales bacterium]|nr:hypothetical protein [Rhodospirillales bacterium]